MKTPRLIIVVLIPWMLGACTASDSLDQRGGEPDRSLNGSWEAVDTHALDDESIPFRMRFFIDSSGLQNLQFCSLGGAHGFTQVSSSPVAGSGQHEFELAPGLPNTPGVKIAITHVDSASLILNGKYEYRRRISPQGSSARGQLGTLATDAGNSLCSQ